MIKTGFKYSATYIKNNKEEKERMEVTYFWDTSTAMFLVFLPTQFSTCNIFSVDPTTICMVGNPFLFFAYEDKSGYGIWIITNRI